MLRIGVSGAGHLGKIHLNLIKEIPGFQLMGFFDTDPLTAKQVAEEFNIRCFDNYSDLLNSVDAVDIVTPTSAHFADAAEAIKKGKHVFIEKPMTNTVEEAENIVALSRKANVRVQAGHVERFNPAFIAAQPYINSPMFIETHRLAQFNPRGTDVSVVLDLMIHDIDIVLSLVKSPLKKIHASGVAVISDSPDIANARMEFENGCVANLTASRISMKKMRKSRFFQRDAYIAVDFLKRKTEVIRLKELIGQADPLSVIIDLGKNKGQKIIYFENPQVTESNAIKSELESFALSILDNKEPMVSAIDGLNALKVAHQVLESLNMSLLFSS
ncbi:MAG TPA: Gfo/Idh/MocA family oxidoreductase [Bacteroidia bacterium]|nr:Gfo/Idh/MocA family oxidoreductase [Bacteroidia bacterium]